MLSPALDVRPPPHVQVIEQAYVYARKVAIFEGAFLGT
jgi:hypothetical protein